MPPDAPPFDSLAHEAGGLTLDENSAGLDVDYQAMYEAGYYPLGSNELPLSINFEERLRYKNANYFEDFGLPKPLDSLYDKNFFGRVDPLQNVIVPVRLSPAIPDAGGMYKQIADDNIFAFNFVADAFFDFRRNMKAASERNCLTAAESNLANPTATRGWTDYRATYDNFFAQMVTRYNTYLYNLEKDRFNEVLTFQDYVDGFYNFLLTGQYGLPVTLTEYIISPLVDPLQCGLAIEVAQENHAEDLNKFVKYIRDINFPYYTRAARKYGFYVDKNAPWRLWADLYSTPMRKKAYDSLGSAVGQVLRDRSSGAKWTVDPSTGHAVITGPRPEYSTGGTSIVEGDWPILGIDGGAISSATAGPAVLFNTYYQPTYLLDLRLFITKITTAWNDFVVENPRVIAAVPGTVRCPQITFRTLNYRYTISEAHARALGDAYWFEYYIKLRERETRVQYRNKPYLVEQALRIMQNYNLNEALKYVNNLFKPYIYDERFFANNKLTAKQ